MKRKSWTKKLKIQGIREGDYRGVSGWEGLL